MMSSLGGAVFNRCLATLAGVAASYPLFILEADAADYTLHTFQRIQLTDKFWTEAPAIGDINRDGHVDVVVGPFWYEGPDFRKRHALYPATETFRHRRPDGTEEVVEGF